MPTLLNPFQSHAKANKSSSVVVSPQSKESSPSASPSASSSKSSKKIGSHATSRSRVSSRKDFLKVTVQGGGKEESFNNPESLPSLQDAYLKFKQMYPKFCETVAVDRLREREYGHLAEREHICMDYCGFGLFSHWQQVMERAASSFGLAYISANLPTHALYGAADEGTIESCIRKRIMDYLKISESDYSMVFTASRGSAFKLLAESYPFHINGRLLTAYDYESEAVSWMVGCAKEKGVRVSSAAFKWPSLQIATTNLKQKLQERRKKKEQQAQGLFVFPVQSRLTGAKYSFQWMSQAQANKWHVLLDASALGPKDMDSLGLSLFRPDFIVSSFYKVFGTDPTGFGCLFIKNSAIQCLRNSSRARGVGMVRIIPSGVGDPFSPAGSDLGEESQKTLEIHEVGEEMEEYLQGTAWPSAGKPVDPVSSFSGPVTPFYWNEEVLEGSQSTRTDAGEAAVSTPGEDGSRRTSGQSEIEEEWEVIDKLEVGSRMGPSPMEAETWNHNPIYCDNSGETGPSAMPSSAKIKEEEEEHEIPLSRRQQSVELGKLETSEPLALDPKCTGVPEIDSITEGREEKVPEIPYGSWGREEASSSQPRSRMGDFEYHLKEAGIPDQDAAEVYVATSSYWPQGKGLDFEEGLQVVKDGNVAAGRSSPLFHSPPVSHQGFRNGEQMEGNYQETVPYREGTGERMGPEGELYTAHEEEGEHSLEERGAERFFVQRGRLSLVQEDLEEDLGGSDREVYGTNGRRSQNWSPRDQGSSRWADHLSMSLHSINGSLPRYYEDEEGIVGRSEGDMVDEEERWGTGSHRSDPFMVCNGLDHADSQGLTKINLRLRYLINWLINGLLKLRHPAHMDSHGVHLVHIYGPRVKFDRGASVAFNLFDWKGALVQPGIVQRLADRNNISLGLGTLCNIVFPEGSTDLPGLGPSNKKGNGSSMPGSDGKFEASRASSTNKGYRPSSIPVVTAALGFLTNFEDVYRLWAFVAKFLDADFTSREARRYHSLNQEMVVL